MTAALEHRKRFDGRPAFEVEHTVTYADTNAVGNVYFATYFAWQGKARELFLAGHAPGVVDDLRTRHVLVTVEADCSFLAELWPFDRIVIRTYADDPVQNRLTLHFDYWRTGGAAAELVARGQQTVAWFERVPDGRPRAIPVPGELVEAVLAGRAAGGFTRPEPTAPTAAVSHHPTHLPDSRSDR